MGLHRISAQRLAARSRTRLVSSARRFLFFSGNDDGSGCCDIGIDVGLKHQSPHE
jgi:hypothetical protein